jgi:zinc transport system substrate-binding protein
MFKYLATSALLFASPLAAETLRVVADIPPIHSLTAQVMGDLGTPALLTEPSASPHGHALRPSEAARLQAADLLVWVGPTMSPWLAEAREDMAKDAASLPLMEAEGSTVLPKRGAHMHDHDHDHAHEEKPEAKAEDHDHDHSHDDDHGHDKAETADAPRPDPHLWLDPQNATLWLTLIAEELAQLDPDNAESYRSNAAAAAEAITAQAAEAAARLAPLAGREFLTAHDAYQYFEARFGLTSHAAITDAEDAEAGPAHLRDVLASSDGLGCFITEPSTPSASIRLVTETLSIPAVEIDPLGAALPLGAAQYAALMESLTSGFETCLKQP